MKRTLRMVHKYLSLAMATLWLLQAVTGALLVFHWELDDWGASGPRQPLDPVALNDSLQQLQNARPAQRVLAIYTSGGLSGRYDVVISDGKDARNVLRVDGRGTVLRERPWDHDFSHIGVFQITTYLHQTLFLHTPGNWIMGVSGLLLFTNICIGVYQAWPRAGQWLRVLSPFVRGSRTAKFYQWHRALGLALALPALIVVAAGVIRAFDDPLSATFDTHRSPPATTVASGTSQHQPPRVANVISTALNLYPGSRLASVDYPTTDAPYFTVHVTQSTDVRRFWGTTTLYISNQTGAVLANYDAKKMPVAVELWDAIYPLHTGEIAGVPGRCVVLLVAIALILLLGFGITLFFLRRRPASRA